MSNGAEASRKGDGYTLFPFPLSFSFVFPFSSSFLSLSFSLPFHWPFLLPFLVLSFPFHFVFLFFFLCFLVPFLSASFSHGHETGKLAPRHKKAPRRPIRAQGHETATRVGNLSFFGLEAFPFSAGNVAFLGWTLFCWKSFPLALFISRSIKWGVCRPVYKSWFVSPLGLRIYYTAGSTTGLWQPSVRSGVAF